MNKNTKLKDANNENSTRGAANLKGFTINWLLPGSRRSGTRSAGRQMLEVVRMNTSFGDRSFAAAAPRVWNNLPDAVRNSALSEDAFAK